MRGQLEEMKQNTGKRAEGRGGGVGADIFEADNEIFNFMAIVPGMYKSHMPQFYLKEVEKLVATH